MNPMQGTAIVNAQSLEHFPKLGTSSLTTEKATEAAHKINEKDAKSTEKNNRSIKAEIIDTKNEESEKYNKKETNKKIVELIQDKKAIQKEKETAIAEKNAALKELEETKRLLKEKEAPEAEISLLRSAKENAIADKNAILEELHKVQLQLKTTESLKDDLNDLKRQLDEFRDTTKTEEKTTLFGKDIKHAKEQLTALHSEVVNAIQLVSNAILKNEIPENYSKNESQIYTDATQGLIQKGEQYKAIFENLKQSKEDFHNAMKNRNSLADDSNDSWVLSERVEKDLHFLEKSIAFPNHLKTLTDKVNALLTSVNLLIERDFIDTKNYLELSQKVDEVETEKKSTEAEGSKKEKTPKFDQEKLVDIKKLYNEKIILKDQYTALHGETDKLFELLKEIKEYKKAHLDAPQSQESKQTKISVFFNQLNESVQFWEKDFVAQNNLKDYQIYDAEKREDLINKLKTTQEKSLANHTTLRNWCATTWNKTLNDLDLLECKLELLADKVKVNNEMSLTLNELGTLKMDANVAPKTFTGPKLAEQLQVLKPRFADITKKLSIHFKEYQELQKKYEEKINELTKKTDKTPATILDKKIEPQTTHSQLPKETVLKNINDTQNNIKTLTETQKNALKTQWDTLFSDRYWNTCRDFETIYDATNSSWLVMWGAKTLGWKKGEFTQEFWNIQNPPSSTASVQPTLTAQSNTN